MRQRTTKPGGYFMGYTAETSTDTLMMFYMMILLYNSGQAEIK